MSSPDNPSPQRQVAGILDAPTDRPGAGSADPIDVGSMTNRFVAHFEPNHEAASSTRRAARALIDTAGIPSAVAADLELIVAELSSNAVEQEPTETIHLDIAIAEHSVVIEITNELTGDDRPGHHRPSSPDATDELADRGWGLAIVDSLSDGLAIERHDGRTVVRVLRRY